MEFTRETNSDASSTNEEFIEMDVKEDGAEMTDSEIQMELDVIQRFKECLGQKNMTSVETLANTPLATPKIQSVVVIPEPASSRPIAAESQRGVTSDRVNKTPNRNRNRSGSVKNKVNKSDGSSSPIMASFLKGKTPVRESASKPIIKLKEEGSIVTPVSNKRIRSTNTTPDEVHKQPDKLVRLQGGSYRKTPDNTVSYNLLEHRTKSKSVCLAQTTDR